MDKVLKYESLMDELAPVFRTLNTPFQGTLGVTRNRSIEKTEDLTKKSTPQSNGRWFP